MKATLIIILILLCSTASFWLGKALNGSYYKEHKIEEITFQNGKIKKVYGIDEYGLPFMHPGSDWIEFIPNDGSEHVTLFRIDRAFQESKPYLDKMKPEGNSLTWEDGYRKYSLSISEIPESDPVDGDQ